MLLAILILLLFATPSKAQEGGSCGKTVLLLGSVSFRSNISAELKIGIWQNREQGGFTAFAGVATDIKVTRISTQTINGKPVYDTSNTQDMGAFFELGYKKKIADRVFIQALGGVAGSAAYIGGELLYQPKTNDLLIGICYKRSTAQISVYFSF
jgi:hypothetical protein